MFNKGRGRGRGILAVTQKTLEENQHQLQLQSFVQSGLFDDKSKQNINLKIHSIKPRYGARCQIVKIC